MRPTPWKSLLSYFYDIRIESAPSVINPHLNVYLSKGRYQLTTAHAIYSFGDLYANFVHTFQRLNWEVITGKTILVLGLGLGSIPFMLERRFKKSFSYTAVEADEQVIYLARKYVLDELRSHVEIIHEDAVSFIWQTSRCWDMICLDLFIDDEIPQGAQTGEFMIRLKACLTENGVLLYNRLSRTRDDVEQTKQFLETVFMPAFPAGGYLEAGGNWILVNDLRFFRRTY
jgi:hypothetical protein